MTRSLDGVHRRHREPLLRTRTLAAALLATALVGTAALPALATTADGPAITTEAFTLDVVDVGMTT